MTTLPPEENENATPSFPSPDTPVAPEAPSAPAAPSAPVGGQTQPGAAYPAPQQPNYPAPPQQPGYPAPQQPGAFPTGPQPGYGAPQQPGYGAPQAPAGAPPGYYQPQGAQANPISNLQTNYWLSVFFIWVPALIFYLIEKDRATPQVRALHAANLNFSLMRTGLFVVGWILAIIPVLGPLLMGVAHLAGFVLHIIAATKVSDTYARGGGDPFLFNLPMVK